jgi:hypothetical protein
VRDELTGRIHRGDAGSFEQCLNRSPTRAATVYDAGLCLKSKSNNSTVSRRHCLHDVSNPCSRCLNSNRANRARRVCEGMHVTPQKRRVFELLKRHSGTYFHRFVQNLNLVQARYTRDVHQASRGDILLSDISHHISATSDDEGCSIVVVQTLNRFLN